MRSTTSIACLVIAGLLLVGCGERRAETGSPRTYQHDGIEFEYPGNWKVTEDDREGEVRLLLVETPGEAIVVIQITPEDMAAGLREFAETFARSAREQTPIGKIGKSSFAAAKNQGEYEVLTERFSISLLGEGTPHTRTYHRRNLQGKALTIILQVADEDGSKVVKGAEQIVSSFKLGKR